MSSNLPPSARRGLNIALAAAVAVAMVGFFTGTHGAPAPGGYAPHGASERTGRVAPKSDDMAAVRYLDRGAQQAAALAALSRPPRELTAQVELDAEAYATSVALRGAGRAYDGAPPTIPHAVDQRGAPACLACHERGMSVEGKVAPVMSHASFSSCQQCHVTRSAGPPSAELPPSVDTASTFVGIASPGHGERAWPGAPPQMPHRSFMRERCASCHGVWATGLASSHPYRQSCRQCHEPAAGADQFPRSTFEPLGVLEEGP